MMRHNGENCPSCARLLKPLTDEQFLSLVSICVNDELTRRFPKLATLSADMDSSGSADIASLQTRIADAIGVKRDS